VKPEKTRKTPLKEPIPVRLTNRRAQFRCPPEVQSRLKPLFAYDIPGARFSDAYRMGSWDGKANLMRAGGVSTGLYLEMRAELTAAGWKFDEEDIRRRPTRHRKVPDPNARPYQTKAVEAMVKASNTGGVVLVATGAGKTRLTGDLFRQLAGRSLFIVDELTLLEQARGELAAATGEEVGIVGRGEFRPKRITAATIQTLHRHRDDPAFVKWFREVDVIVIDELHLALAKRNLDVVKLAQPLASFGLTATIEWEKPHVRMPAAALCGPIIFRYQMATGVKEGYLSEGVALCVKFEDPLRGMAPGYSFRRGNEWVTVETGSPEADYRYRIALSGPRNEMIAHLARDRPKPDETMQLRCQRPRLDALIRATRVNVHRLGIAAHLLQREAAIRVDVQRRRCARLPARNELDRLILELQGAHRVSGRDADERPVAAQIDAV